MVKNLIDSSLVDRLAQMSSLTISSDQKPMIIKKLSETLSFVSNLEELHPPSTLSRLRDGKNVTFEDGTPNTRALSAQQVFQNCNKNKFEVPKVI